MARRSRFFYFDFLEILNSRWILMRQGQITASEGVKSRNPAGLKWTTNNDAAAWCRRTFLCNYHKIITGHSWRLGLGLDWRPNTDVPVPHGWFPRQLKTCVYVHSCLPDPNVSITAETPLCQCRDLLVPVYFLLSSPQSTSRTVLFLFTRVCRQEMILKHELCKVTHNRILLYQQLL